MSEEQKKPETNTLGLPLADDLSEVDGKTHPLGGFGRDHLKSKPVISPAETYAEDAANRPDRELGK